MSWTTSDTGFFKSLCYNLRNVVPNYGIFLVKHPVCVCIYVCIYIYIYIYIYASVYYTPDRTASYPGRHSSSQWRPWEIQISQRYVVFLRLPPKLRCLSLRLSRPPAVLTVCSCYEAALRPLRRLPVFLSFSALKNVIANPANGGDKHDR